MIKELLLILLLLGGCTQLSGVDNAEQLALDAFEGKDPTIIETKELDCPGCYLVKVQTGNKIYHVNIKDNELENIVLQGDEIDSFYVDYRNSSLIYNITVTKPNPCAEVITDLQTLESYPVQLRLDIQMRDSGRMCAQVIEEKNIQGSIPITGNFIFQVYVDGTEMYEKTYLLDEELNETCIHDADCQAPPRYKASSVCPYESECIDGECRVVCKS